MKLIFDVQLAANYKSLSQRARILTEHWVGKSVFCPNCGQLNIDKYINNRPVADFYCPNCKEDYELKSKQKNIGIKILDGAYRTKIERLQSNSNPNLFVLNYHPQSLSVLDFFVIPKHFFVPEIIEKRKPLAVTARRSGWIGSNILLQKVPQAGKIFLVRQEKIESKKKVLAEWKKLCFCGRKRKYPQEDGCLMLCVVLKGLGNVNLSLMMFINLRMSYVCFIKKTSILKIKSVNNYRPYAIKVILILCRVDIIDS